ncbi:hypothetical protein ACFWBG_20510 [Nocardia salmonicida]|uniref:DUF6630 family protein n=1 Tax=Nocardia salmonicida TaxID=53431 RepID=UPI00366ACFEE
MVIDFVPRLLGRFSSAHIAAAQRAALFDLVELIAPDAEKSCGRLEYVLANASWSASDPEDTLIEVLFDGCDGGLVYFGRVVAGPDAIRSRLALLPTCPKGLTWDWYDGDICKTEADLQTYLRLSGDHCRTVGTALIGVVTGKNGLVLGFLPSDKLERFIELAATADAEIVIYGTVEPGAHRSNGPTDKSEINGPT